MPKTLRSFIHSFIRVSAIRLEPKADSVMAISLVCMLIRLVERLSEIRLSKKNRILGLDNRTFKKTIFTNLMLMMCVKLCNKCINCCVLISVI